jgi:hypothetical protein
MQTAQIIFYPLRYCTRFPTYDVQVWLHERQLEFQSYYQQLEFEETNKYNIALRKQMIHNKLRESIYLL